MSNTMDVGKRNLSRLGQDISILAVSAQTRTQIEQKITACCTEIEAGKKSTTKICLNAARSFSIKNPHRFVLVIRHDGDIKDALNEALEADPNQEKPGQRAFAGQGRPPGKIAFLFPGQGSQYLNMGKELFDAVSSRNIMFSGVYRIVDGGIVDGEIVDGNHDLEKRIYPSSEAIEANGKGMEIGLRATDVAQPAIGVVSIEMMKILSGFNVCADAAAGHSFGELTALCAGKRIDEATFHRLAAARGRFMADAGGTDKGKMIAMIAPLETIEALIRDNDVDAILANRNGPAQGVVSGTSDAIWRMKLLCRENRIKAIDLPVSAAFHSRLVSEAALPFKKMLESVTFSSGSLPVYSNTTARPYPEGEADARTLLGDHLLNPVNFIEEIRNMHEDGARIFIEVGPKKTLTGLVSSILKGSAFYACAMDGSQGKSSGIMDLALLLARLAALGYLVDIEKWHASVT